MKWPEYRKFTPDLAAAVEEWIVAMKCPILIARAVRKKFHTNDWTAEQIRHDYKTKLENQK